MLAKDHITGNIDRGIVWDAGQITSFRFEEDFIEDNIRCIPMLVRFKLDACGIKLKLEEWCRFTFEERRVLVHRSCATGKDIAVYRKYLQLLVLQKTGMDAADLTIENNPAWANKEIVFETLAVKATQLGAYISVQRWSQLTNLQRFALVKLSGQSHESKNLLVALNEFGLLKATDETFN